MEKIFEKISQSSFSQEDKSYLFSLAGSDECLYPRLRSIVLSQKGALGRKALAEEIKRLKELTSQIWEGKALASKNNTLDAYKSILTKGQAVLLSIQAEGKDLPGVSRLKSILSVKAKKAEGTEATGAEATGAEATGAEATGAEATEAEATGAEGTGTNNQHLQQYIQALLERIGVLKNSIEQALECKNLADTRQILRDTLAN